eukprot:3948441-Alexandrium_andersonii.AAC.1
MAHYLVRLRTTAYYRVLPCTAELRALQATAGVRTSCRELWESQGAARKLRTTSYHGALPRTTAYYRVLPRATAYC